MLVMLKGCPFCGGKVNFHSFAPYNPSFECFSCGAVVYFGNYCSSLPDYIKSWNRRDCKRGNKFLSNTSVIKLPTDNSS